MTASHHNRVLRAAEKRALKLESRMADVLEPILRQAGRDAARRFQTMATDHLTASAHRRADWEALKRSGYAPVWGNDRRSVLMFEPSPMPLTAAVDVQSNSTMVCVKPRPAEADAIADPDGTYPEYLHVTLAYLGELDGSLLPVLDALRAVAASHAPLAGVVGGYGQFGMADGSSVGILLPDVPGLVELRVAVTEALQAAGISYGRDHGFEAHLTVDGDPEPGELEEMLPLSGSPLHFDDLVLVRGDTEVYPLPLVGSPPLTAAGGGQPDWSAPAGSEVLDVAALTRTLRGKTDPVHNAVVETVMGTSLRKAGISFDVENPLVQKVLAQAGSQVTEIAQTTQLNVMRVIRASYEQGLTIPDTAKAIQVGMAEAAPIRATLIARTELAGAVNGGSLAATQIVQEVTGVGYRKEWLTADGAKYPRHADYDGLDGQVQNLEDPFDVGGVQMMHPADPDGPPEEVCNCRCTMAYTDQPSDENA